MLIDHGRVVHQPKEHGLFDILNYKSSGKHYLIIHHQDCVDGMWGAALAEEMLCGNNHNTCDHLAYQYVETRQIKIDPERIPDYIVTVDMSPNQLDLDSVCVKYPNIQWLITDHHDDKRVARITNSAQGRTNVNVVFSKFLGGCYLLRAIFYAVNGIYYQTEANPNNQLSMGNTSLKSEVLEEFLFLYIHVDNHFGNDMYRDITYYVGFRDIWLERSSHAKDINKILRNIILSYTNPIEYLREIAATELELMYIHRPFKKFSATGKPSDQVKSIFTDWVDDFINDHSTDISNYYQSGLVSLYSVAETDFTLATKLTEIGAERKLIFAVGNIPTAFVSDTSEVIYSNPFKGHIVDFVLTIMPSITGDFMYFSVRSRNPDGVDLIPVLAKLFGEGVGGGHKHAAGGRISYDQGVKFLRSLNIIAR